MECRFSVLRFFCWPSLLTWRVSITHPVPKTSLERNASCVKVPVDPGHARLLHAQLLLVSNISSPAACLSSEPYLRCYKQRYKSKEHGYLHTLALAAPGSPPFAAAALQVVISQHSPRVARTPVAAAKARRPLASENKANPQLPRMASESRNAADTPLQQPSSSRQRVASILSHEDAGRDDGRPCGRDSYWERRALRSWLWEEMDRRAADFSRREEIRCVGSPLRTHLPLPGSTSN